MSRSFDDEGEEPTKVIHNPLLASRGVSVSNAASMRTPARDTTEPLFDELLAPRRVIRSEQPPFCHRAIPPEHSPKLENPAKKRGSASSTGASLALQTHSSGTWTEQLVEPVAGTGAPVPPAQSSATPRFGKAGGISRACLGHAWICPRQTTGAETPLKVRAVLRVACKMRFRDRSTDWSKRGFV